MNYEYTPKGTCSRKIMFDLSDSGIINSVKFIGGCDGNLKGISTLIVGERAETVIKKLEGIKCGFKSTSCPDQLSKALNQALLKEKAMTK